jgi:hypothetical protein
MWAPFFERDGRQGFDLVEFRYVHSIDQVPERIEVVGDLGQERFVELQAYGTTQTFDLYWG